MKSYQIKYKVLLTTGEKEGIYLVRASYPQEALNLFDREMVERYTTLKWILHREFI